MSVDSAFAEYQKKVNADEDQVAEARRRRDLFKSAFSDEDDIEEVRPSGSLARGTEKDPIHDVDTILVFKAGSHPGWGEAG
ncbi:nucleotidyltransferase, partial [Salmonella enterica subsp. enterica serovar Senftenberg]|nr:nucleotidyltransferase [Salmonella enterica subsp. enterica serovar Senftenberg]